MLEVALRTKLHSSSYWLFPLQIHFQKLSSPLKKADSGPAKETVLFGAGIPWLFRLTHLRAFVSSSLARSCSRPSFSSVSVQDVPNVKHLGEDDGMGETKVNYVL